MVYWSVKRELNLICYSDRIKLFAHRTQVRFIPFGGSDKIYGNEDS